MVAFHLHRCLNHADREAVARCPACQRFFCRECVAEHEGRILCARCLQAATRQVAATVSRWWWARLAGPWVAGLLVGWIAFYGLGRVLLATPDRFHQGTVWQSQPDRQENEP